MRSRSACSPCWTTSRPSRPAPCSGSRSPRCTTSCSAPTADWPERRGRSGRPSQLALPVAAGERARAPAGDRLRAALVQLSSVLGELAEAVRDLRRETDAERRERVDDLAVLIDLITTGWQGLDARLGRIERQVSRLESGRREPGSAAPARSSRRRRAPPAGGAAGAPRRVAAAPPSRARATGSRSSRRFRSSAPASSRSRCSSSPPAGRTSRARLRARHASADDRRGRPRPTTAPAETRPAATTARPPAQTPTTPATTSGVLGTTARRTTRPKPPAAPTAPQTTSAPPAATTRPDDARPPPPPGFKPTRNWAWAPVAGADYYDVVVHPGGHGVLPGVADRAEADAPGHGRLPAGPLPLGRPARLRRALREEPRRAGRRLAVHRLLISLPRPAP